MIDASTSSGPNPPIRVALVDDQPLFSAGLKMILRSQPDLELVGEAVDGEAALSMIAESRPDVVLMDIRMPKLDGITATRRLLSGGGPHPQVIVLTTIQHDEAVVRAIQAGAAGFLTKDTTPEFLLAAIRTVQAGHSVMAPKASNELLRDYLTPPEADRSVLDGLSEREQEVFLAAARGQSNAEIAAGLFLGEATVKTHMGNILTKLRLKSRIQLVAFAYEHGLLSTKNT